jgi:catechol 2,3-dioxygenase-like lactoylglutathione lyase family enzyme
MATRKKAEAEGAEESSGGGTADVPSLFRINVEVGDLDQAAKFYGKLLGLAGRKQAGSRCYFTCGPVTLQVVDVSTVRTPHPAAKALYFVVNDLEGIFERAKSLECLSQEEVHGSHGGKISVQPWGERSFYAEDPWHNPLCFVESGTIYPG